MVEHQGIYLEVIAMEIWAFVVYLEVEEELSTMVEKLRVVEETGMAAAAMELTAEVVVVVKVATEGEMGVLVAEMVRVVLAVMDLVKEKVLMVAIMVGLVEKVLMVAEAAVSGEETVVLVEMGCLGKDRWEKAIDHRFHTDIGKMGRTLILLVFFLHYAFFCF